MIHQGSRPRPPLLSGWVAPQQEVQEVLHQGLCKQVFQAVVQACPEICQARV